MDIKYGPDGQPLPWEKQDASKQAAPAVEAAPVQNNPLQVEDVAEVQLQNPFVQQYIKEQQEAQHVPAEQQITMSEETEPIADFEGDEEPVATPKKEDHPNFRALRLAAERAERERDEALRILRERDLRDYDRPAKRAQEPEPDDVDLADDGYVEPKHIKKQQRELKSIRKELDDYKQKTAKELQEMMLYKQYPDIETVVSPENIAILRELKPAYARQLTDMHAKGDIYGTGELAYNYMKDLGIYKAQAKTEAKDYTADKMRVKVNAAKPRSSATVQSSYGAESPLARAQTLSGDLSAEDMRKHYAEMEAAIRKGY